MAKHLKVFIFFYTAMLIGFLIAAHAHAGQKEAYAALSKASARLPCGSGAAIRTPSGKSRVITNFHVCIPSMVERQVRATDIDGNAGNGKVYKMSPEKDLCLIDSPASLTPLNVAKSTDYLLTEVYTRGYPLGVLTNSKGIVLKDETFEFISVLPSDMKCTGKEMHDLHTGILLGCMLPHYNKVSNMYAQPGSSGSPVVNAQGELVGVMETYVGEYGGGFIPLKDVKEFLKGE